MRVEEESGQGAERKILIAFITNTDFLNRVFPRWEKDFLGSRWSNLVVSFCLKYYKKYNKAPKQTIESLFREWSETRGDKDTISLVEKFLGSLSDEYERQEEEEVDFLVDLAENYVNKSLLRRLEEDLRSRREGTSREELEEAISKVSNFKPVKLTPPKTLSVLEDKEAQKKALEDKQRVLITYPGPAGEFFGDELSEDSFVAFMAGPKSKKSYMLLDVAWRSMLQGNKTAYFQVGDLSRNQIMRRFLKRAVYRPISAKMIRYPTGIALPSGMDKPLAIVDYLDKTYEQPISWEKAERAFAKKAKKFGDNLRLAYYPIKTISILQIKSLLEDWDREGWQAKVVIIDYPENLAPINVKDFEIKQIADTWAMCRQISEVRKCLVVVASQTNKEGFKSYILTRNNFRGNLMILAHVTAFLGINTTDEERSFGLSRLNFVVRREEGFSESLCLHCAGCLDVSNPIVRSAYQDRR